MTYNTDKEQTNLLLFYEKLFLPYKDKAVNFLELGVYKGGSIQWAMDYFAKGSGITGVDINPPQAKIEGFNFIHGNYSDEKTLKLLTSQSYDIIIDDCSHETAPTKKAFEHLWNCVKKGGLYIIEDWAVEWLTWEDNWHNDKFNGMAHLVIDLTRGIKHSTIYRSPNVAVYEKWE